MSSEKVMNGTVDLYRMIFTLRVNYANKITLMAKEHYFSYNYMTLFIINNNLIKVQKQYFFSMENWNLLYMDKIIWQL